MVIEILSYLFGLQSAGWQLAHWRDDSVNCEYFQYTSGTINLQNTINRQNDNISSETGKRNRWEEEKK